MLLIQKTEILEMLVEGAREVIKNQKNINAINVFPVPDADTGSNLARTLSNIEKVVNESRKSTNKFDEILNSILTLSSGNSGIMITAYLSGLLSDLKDKEEVGERDFEKSFFSGAKSARASVENPKSGTMLDVIDTYAAEFKKSKSFEKAQVATISSLKGTEKKMKVLSDNHVVDAGALGFCIFIFAFTQKITNLKFDPKSVDSKPVKIDINADFGKYFYEVIFIISNSEVKTKDIKNMFHPMGDSLDLVEVEEKIKVHIHTNEPTLVADTALLIGTVESIRTVDMRKEAAHH